MLKAKIADNYNKYKIIRDLNCLKNISNYDLDIQYIKTSLDLLLLYFYEEQPYTTIQNDLLGLSATNDYIFGLHSKKQLTTLHLCKKDRDIYKFIPLCGVMSTFEPVLEKDFNLGQMKFITFMANSYSHISICNRCIANLYSAL